AVVQLHRSGGSHLFPRATPSRSPTIRERKSALESQLIASSLFAVGQLRLSIEISQYSNFSVHHTIIRFYGSNPGQTSHREAGNFVQQACPRGPEARRRQAVPVARARVAIPPFGLSGTC